MLHRISDASPKGATGDVIFVHGLDGNHKTTWQHKNGVDLFWPAMLASDFPHTNVWSLEYDVAPSAWKGNTMPLVDRATNILALLEAHKIGTRPLMFVCHSLGGLLVKQLLRSAYGYSHLDWSEIARKTVGIVFLSTPNSGSGLANWLSYIRLARPTVSIRELEKNAPALRDLNLWFRATLNGYTQIKLEVLYEKLPTRGLLVVDDSSADPGVAGIIPIPLDEDHISICKPSSKTSLQYMLVRDFVEQTFESADHSSSLQDLESDKLRKYWVVFDREAFRVPCVFEGALHWVSAALSDVSAAMGTGTLYSREGRLVKEIDPISSFENEDIRTTLSKIRGMIKEVQKAITVAEIHIIGADVQDRKRFHHMEFHLLDRYSRDESEEFIKEAFRLMDIVDNKRNEMIKLANELFAAAKIPLLPMITISSEHVRLSSSGIMEYDWSRFYIRTHEELLPILEK